jgi:hypothetical protein
MEAIHLYCYSCGKDERLAADTAQHFLNPETDVWGRVKFGLGIPANALPFTVVRQGAEIGATDFDHCNQSSKNWRDDRIGSCHSLCLICLLNRRVCRPFKELTT